MWEPWLWTLTRNDPSLESLSVFAPRWLSEPAVGVGGLLLADDVFLRTSIDEAITALEADGILTEIVARF